MNLEEFKTKPFPIYTTPRLNLVELDVVHEIDVFNIFSNSKVTEYYNINTFKDLSEASNFIEINYNKFIFNIGICWGITLIDSPKLIGTIELNIINGDSHNANIGFTINHDYWRNGYVTEAIKKALYHAFKVLKLVRVEAYVMPRNYASSCALENIGFLKEGILRQWLQFNECYYDMSLYSILRQDVYPTHLNEKK